MQQADGSVVYEDRTDELVQRFRDAGIDVLVTIGGDGSWRSASGSTRRACG